MGNILYGDLGSEHMVYTDKNSVSYIVQSLYSAARDMMAGYYFAERENCGVWCYVHKYNSRRGGYLTGTAEELTGKLSPAVHLGELKFATKEEFEHKQHLGSTELEPAAYPLDRSIVLQLLVKLFAALRDQKTLYLVLSQENCSERDYMLRGLSVCRQILSVLPAEYQKRISFVSNTMPAEKSGLKFSVIVLPRKYQDIYMTENYKPFDEPVFDLSQPAAEPEDLSPLTKYYADCICGKAAVKNAQELLDRVTPGKDFNMRIYENIYALYYYGQKAQAAAEPEQFWHYWRIIANKKAQRTYGPLNYILKRLPKPALELLRKKQEEEVQKKEAAQQKKADAEQAASEAESMLQALFDRTVHVKESMDQAITWRQYAFSANNADEAAEYLDKAKHSAAETKAFFDELEPLCNTVRTAVETANAEPEFRSRGQNVWKQTQQYHTLAQQYIAEADKAVQDIGSIITQKKNQAQAQEIIALVRTDLARANTVYTETILPTLRQAYDALHDVQQTGRAELAERKLYVLRGLKEDIRDHADIVCEYAQSAAAHLAEALSLDRNEQNIPALKQSIDSVCNDARRAEVSLAEAERQMKALREQAKAEEEAKRLAAEQEAAAAHKKVEAALDAVELPAETVLDAAAMVSGEPEILPEDPELAQTPGSDLLNFLHPAGTQSSQLAPELRRIMSGTAAMLEATAAQVTAAAEEQPKPKTVRLGMPKPVIRTEEPEQSKPPVQTNPEEHTLPDLPYTRDELLSLLARVSPIMFDVNKNASMSQSNAKKKKGIAGIRAARKAGVMGFRLYPREEAIKEEKYGKDRQEYIISDEFWDKLYLNHPDSRDVEIRGQYDSAEDARFFGTRDYIVLAMNTWLRDLRLASVQVYCKKGAVQKQFCKTDADEALFCWFLGLMVFYRHEPKLAKMPAVQALFDLELLSGFFSGKEERAKLCCFFALMHAGCMLQVNLLTDAKARETAKRYVSELSLKGVLEDELVGRVLKSTSGRGDYPFIRECMLNSLLD